MVVIPDLRCHNEELKSIIEECEKDRDFFNRIQCRLRDGVRAAINEYKRDGKLSDFTLSLLQDALE